MEFGLSSEQVLLKDSLDAYLRERAPLDRVRRFADKDEGRATEVIAGLNEIGLSGLIIPTEHGGVGLGALDACVASETLGYRIAPVPFVANAIMVPTALMLAGSPAQQANWLPRIAAGKTVVGAALAERSGARAVAGSQAGVTAVDGRLSGRALYVLDFEADAYLVGDMAGGLHLVASDAAGLGRQRLETVDRTRPIGELTFDRVAAEPLAGADAAVIQRVLDIGRTMLAADSLGAAQNMIDQAVAYAGQRVQFGRVIGSFQAVKHMCAQMAADLEPTRAFVWYAGHALDEIPLEASLVACQLKAHLSEVASSVAKTATEVHGGMGFTDLVGLHYWFKRIGFNRQMLGSPESLRGEAARLQGLTDLTAA